MSTGISHAFVSAKADGSDNTLVQPSNWNATHVIASEFNVPVVASPATPATGANVFVKSIAGRPMLAQLGPSGLSTAFQPFLGRNKVALVQAASGVANWTAIGVTVSTDGTATQRAPASTNMCTSLRRLGVVSASTGGSAAGIRVAQLGWWLGNGSGLGGFTFVARFNVSDAALVATANMFVGFRATTAAVTDVDPSTLTNIIGVGCTSGDTALQLYCAGSVAQPRTSLGASFPINTTNTDVYELMLFAAPNATQVQYVVNRLNTGDTASGTLTTNLPANTQFLAPAMWRSNGGTASAVGIDIGSLYIETDN